jgi:choline kinase
VRAILFAAGVGSRLGLLTADRPKILLEIGGRTLLDRHVERLLEVGVADVLVVAGHRRELVEAEIERIRAVRDVVTLRAVCNPDYREGSALSVAAALEAMTPEAAPFLLMDGDVLYGESVLRRLVDSPHPTCLLVDRDCAVDEDDPVLVPMRGGRPFDFRKRFRGPYDAIGESVGFFKLGAADLERWTRATRSRTVGERRRETLEDVVRELVVEDRFSAEDVTGLPWIEIDYPEDVERARTEILPAL